MKIGRISYFILGLALAVLIEWGSPFFFSPDFLNFWLASDLVSGYLATVLAYLTPAVIILLLFMIIDFAFDKERLNAIPVISQKILLFLLSYVGLSYIFYSFMINF